MRLRGGNNGRKALNLLITCLGECGDHVCCPRSRPRFCRLTGNEQSTLQARPRKRLAAMMESRVTICAID